jgi:hypothetical protein
VGRRPAAEVFAVANQITGVSAKLVHCQHTVKSAKSNESISCHAYAGQTIRGRIGGGARLMTKAALARTDHALVHPVARGYIPDQAACHRSFIFESATRRWRSA